MPQLGACQCIPYPYSTIVHKPDPAVEYYEAYMNIGRKYTRISQYDLAATVFHAAFNLPRTKLVHTKAGTYLIDFADRLNVAVEQTLQGEGQGTILKAIGTMPTVKTAFVTLKGKGSKIKDLTIDLNGANLTYPAMPPLSWATALVAGLDIDCNVASAPEASIENVRVINAVDPAVPNLTTAAVNLFDCPYATVNDLIMEDCDVGFFITKGSGGIVSSYNVRGIHATNIPTSIYFEMADNTKISQVSILNGDIFISGATVHTTDDNTLDQIVIDNGRIYGGLVGTLKRWNFSNMTVKNCTIDPFGHAWGLYKLVDASFSNCKAFNQNNGGFVLSGNGELINCIARECQSYGYDIITAGSSFKLTNCKSIKNKYQGWVVEAGDVELVNCEALNNGQGGGAGASLCGVLLSNVSGCKVIGGRFHDDQVAPTQTYGVLEVGSSDYTRILGSYFKGNVTLPHSLIGANSNAAHTIEV